MSELRNTIVNHPNHQDHSIHPGPSGFDRFGLHKTLMRGIRSAGFDSPRPIQAETIPAAQAGFDVLGLAQTGTGKTAAFALPLLDRLLRDRQRGPRALILAPTRELASQIAAEIRMLAEFTQMKMVTIFGGVSAHNQVRALRRNPEIVVGCPGRVLDLLNQGLLHLDEIETLVLDEADHMFDMGFLPDIRRILSALPHDRQNLLFSATFSDDIRNLAARTLNAPAEIQVAQKNSTADNVIQLVYPVDKNRKRELLSHRIGKENWQHGRRTPGIT